MEFYTRRFDTSALEAAGKHMLPLLNAALARMDTEFVAYTKQEVNQLIDFCWGKAPYTLENHPAIPFIYLCSFLTREIAICNTNLEVLWKDLNFEQREFIRLGISPKSLRGIALRANMTTICSKTLAYQSDLISHQEIYDFYQSIITELIADRIL